MIEGIVDKICEGLSRYLEKRVITRRDGKPYLERYYIFHSDRFKKIPGIYLHKFLSSDEDEELHNHPWGSSVSFILTGGYIEERRNDKRRVVIKDVLPGSINYINHDDFHRVDLIKNYAWTLFMSGNREQDWGFWNRDTDVYTPWQEHIERKAEEDERDNSLEDN